MKEELKQIGLTEGEAKVYLALLKIGSSKVGAIVKESGVSYSKVYDVLGRLIEKGLASFIIKEKTKHFQAVEPNRIKDFLDNQEKEILENKKILEKIMPQLNNLELNDKRSNAQIFVGLNGLKSAYEILTKDASRGDVLLFSYIHDEKYFENADLFYARQFHRFKGLGLKPRGISTLDFKNSKYFTKPPQFIELKFVGFPLPGIIDIFRDKVLFTTWQEKPIAFLIESKEISDNLRNYFESVWTIAKH
jgi:predicted transcriptional regulator